MQKLLQQLSTGSRGEENLRPIQLTKLVELVTAMAERAGVRANADPEIEEVKKDVAPEAVLDEIEAKQTPDD